MKRRDFIAALGSAASAWPVVARAQKQTIPTIAILGSGAEDAPSSVAQMQRGNRIERQIAAVHK